MTIKPYLQLVRLPNVFTAAADSLAGWLLVARDASTSPAAGCRWCWPRWRSTRRGSRSTTVFDYEIDLEERPGRPLPSGRVSRRFAAGLGVTLLVARPGAGRAQRVAASLAVASLLVGLRPGLRRGPEADGARPRGDGGLPGAERPARHEPGRRAGRARRLAGRRLAGRLRRRA